MDVAKLLHDVDCMALSEGAASCFDPPHDVVQCANVRFHKLAFRRRLNSIQVVHGNRVPREIVQHVDVKTSLNNALADLSAIVTRTPH